MEVNVRKAQKRDLGVINSLTDQLHKYLASLYALTLSDEELGQEHFDEEELESVYVAEEEHERVVGYMCFSRYVDEWAGSCYEIEHIVVDEEFRGYGIARKLFDILLERAKKDKVNIRTGTLERNAAAIRFYKELGFRPLYTGLVLDLQKRIVEK